MLPVNLSFVNTTLPQSNECSVYVMSVKIKATRLTQNSMTALTELLISSIFLFYVIRLFLLSSVQKLKTDAGM